MDQDSPKGIPHALLYRDTMIYENTIYLGVTVKKVIYGFGAESRANCRRFGIMLLRMKHVLSVELATIG